jgi:hypothetical protein
LVVAPVELVFYNDATRGVDGSCTPYRQSSDGSGVWVEQHEARVEAMKRSNRSAYAKPIFVSALEAADQYVPDVAGAVKMRIEWKLEERLYASRPVDHE